MAAGYPNPCSWQPMRLRNFPTTLATRNRGRGKGERPVRGARLRALRFARIREGLAGAPTWGERESDRLIEGQLDAGGTCLFPLAFA